MARCGLVDDPLFREHKPRMTHVETPERLEGLGDAVREAVPDVRELPLREATLDQLRLAHADQLIENVRRASEEGAFFDLDTYLCERTFDVARQAAGSVIDATKAVLADEIDFAVCLVRPPGHHATPTRSMGFCIFNNVAIAANAALADGLVERLAVVDFDVHHGNGTQEILWDEPRALFISSHHWGIYPGTGYLDEMGGPAALGTKINIPLPARSGDADYRAVNAEVVRPALMRFEPELLLLSAGYDASEADPLGGMSVTTEGFRGIVHELLEAFGDRRMVFVLEGGYDVPAMTEGLTAQLRQVTDPQPMAEAGEPTPAARRVIDEVKQRHSLGS